MSGRDAQYEIQVHPNIAIPVARGVLAADLLLPSGAAPCPALVLLLPYPKEGTAAVLDEPNRYFAERGYACVIIDSVGTGSSAGRARAPFDPEEAEDGVAALAWAAAQPWCDGSVGMWGGSYGATTTMLTAAQQPPGLKAIATIMGPTAPGPEFVHPDGTRGALPSLGLWSLSTLLMQLMPPLHQIPAGDGDARWRDRLEHLEPHLIDLVRHGPSDPVWQSRRVDPRDIRVPTFCIAGWRDLFCSASLTAYEHIAAPKKLLVGPWMHTHPNDSPVEPVDALPLLCRWWDRWLRDDANGIETEARVTAFIQGRGAWASLPAWPPAAQPLLARPAADHMLSLRTRDLLEPGLVTQRVDPTVGLGSGLWSLPTPELGLPTDSHDDDSRSISFTSEPLPEPLLIAGRPEATVVVASIAATDTTVVVKINDVDHKDRSVLIAVGTARLPPPGPSSPGRTAVRVVLAPTLYELKKGHRLRLVVAGADFPRLWPDSELSELSVAFGGEAAAGTALLLPLLSKDVPVEASVPAPGTSRGTSTSDVAMEASPTWLVEHDHVRDTVAVTFGGRLVAWTQDGSQVVDTEQSVRASVSRSAPGDMHLVGTASAFVRRASGEAVSVHVETEVTGCGATASGDVKVNGERVFARRWSVEFGVPTAPSAPDQAGSSSA